VQAALGQCGVDALPDSVFHLWFGGEEYPHASPTRSALVWCGASGQGGSCSQCPHSATVINAPGARTSASGSITRTAWTLPGTS
jgi:hypothetical protein